MAALFVGRVVVWTALLALGVSGLALAEATTGQPVGTELRFEDLCDASAVLLSGADDLLVADATRNRVLLFGQEGGAPRLRLDLVGHLQNKRYGGAGAAGIAAAAQAGDMLYFVTSHARTAKGRVQPVAHRFFALQTRGMGASQQVRPYEKAYPLLARDMEANAKLGLADSLRLAENLRPDLAPQRGGIDVRGLAVARDGHGLLVALRSPLREGRALVIPFVNPDRVVAGVEAAAFDKPIELDLEGRGIVSLEWVPGQHTYFVLAAPRGPATAEDPDADVSELYRWSGDPAAAPVYVRDVGRGDLRPSAMAASRDGARLVLISRDGARRDAGLTAADCNGRLIDGDQCPCRRRSSLEKRYTRGEWIDVSPPGALELAAPEAPAVADPD